MNRMPFLLLSLACTGIATLQAAPENKPIELDEQYSASYTGQELILLDDAYSHNCAKAFTTKDEQALIHNQVVQYFIRKLSIALLECNTNQEAQLNRQELIKRSETPVQEHITRLANQKIKTENNCQGRAFLAVDVSLAHACQESLEENDGDGLLFLLALRRSSLLESIQLLLASTHPEAQIYNTELLKHLAHTTAVHRQLAQQIAQANSDLDNDTTTE